MFFSSKPYHALIFSLRGRKDVIRGKRRTGKEERGREEEVVNKRGTKEMGVEKGKKGRGVGG